MQSWNVIVEFAIHGPTPLSTGEGFAVWQVSDLAPGVDGPVYGHSDNFNGLGIFFDSYDADGNVSHSHLLACLVDSTRPNISIGGMSWLQGEAESYVLAMFNDGTKTIDQEGAGIQLGVCFTEFRNLPHPARAHITYDGGSASQAHIILFFFFCSLICSPLMACVLFNP
jgi:mannose-binding lectin 1